MRPADANETAQAWRLAVDTDEPVGLVLTRQDIPVLAETEALAEAGVPEAPMCWRRRAARHEIVLVGTGSEVQLCLAAATILAGAGVGAQVGLAAVLGPVRGAGRRLPRRASSRAACPVLSVEAGSTFGWSRYADDSIGIDHFGASAPGAVVMEKFGFTAEHVVERAQALPGTTRLSTEHVDRACDCMRRACRREGASR